MRTPGTLRSCPKGAGPIARGAERGELLILPDERDHALAGGVVQLAECQLADGLMSEAAPGQGWWGTQQQYRRERCKLGHENTLSAFRPADFVRARAGREGCARPSYKLVSSLLAGTPEPTPRSRLPVGPALSHAVARALRRAVCWR